MARPLKEIEQELLTLPRKERADIALRLIRSLDEGIEEDVDAYWKEELMRRSQEIESGKARLIPAEEVFKKARERFSCVVTRPDPAAWEVAAATKEVA